ncbi:RNA methyltransferase [Bdellovibrio sp. HCB337]|uniref:RNA methyltransferase n=1 Tax=Bdellovibrio sp. HCB337 TaxID=3394358 RepID=UPI0039A5A042
MDPKDLKALQNIHRLMLDLEKQAQSQNFSAKALAPIQESLQAFVTHESLDFRKIAAIAPHLTTDMTMKHYVSWIIPVERLLQKELRDDEFLIFSQDQTAKAVEKIPLSFVLHNLRSAFNVGSIFRTAECFGVKHVYLCGYTPLPTQDKLAKTAMGTDSLVEWEEAPKIVELLKKLKSEGNHIVALETTSHAVPLETSFPLEKPTVFILGNERFGIDPEVLELCPEVRKIPLRGQKNSLNVGVATAIATYEFSRQWSAQ